MPIVRVKELAYARVRVPDLDAAQRFFTDLGLIVSKRSPIALYLRATGPEHHVLVVEKGADRFVATAFLAASESDLHKLTSVPGASPVEAIDGPGGGKRVRLTDPDGNGVEVVYGIATAEPLKVDRFELNSAADGLRRTGRVTRHVKGPAHILRIGHAVLASPNVSSMVQWYRDTLGFLRTDDVVDPEQNLMLAFNRLDHGAEYVDHHAIMIQHGDRRGLNHIGFEIQDVDDLMLGHEHMVSNGHDRVWGIGRHVYGSQIFSYWMDPFGFMYEIWTDSDRLNVDHQPVRAPLETAYGPWGEQPPQRFFTQAHE